MKNYAYNAEVVRWVDGDTVDLIVDLGFKITLHERFRLHGVDTPERGQDGFKEATEFCEEFAPVGSRVSVATYKTGKFGRWLCVLYSNAHSQSLNRTLLIEGMAKEYEA